MNGSTETTSHYAVQGMTCAHCDVAVERALRALQGVHTVKADYRSGVVEISASRSITDDEINTALADEGYSLSGANGTSYSRRMIEAAAVLLIVFGGALLVRQFDILPRSLGVSENMTLPLVFAIGLVASVSSCMAVTGGLLVALAAKYNEATTGASARQRFMPHLYFNVGRLISYASFGAVIGFLGASLALSGLASGILTITVSLLMVAIGLQMLGILPRFGALLAIPKSFTNRIHNLVTSNARGSAFLLGAATFFLPCGFTLALQLYVLSSGSALLGAFTMLVFALGTLPALLSLSAISTLAKGRLRMSFLRLAGAIVIFLGVFNIHFGLVQAGSPYTPFVQSTQTLAQTVPAQQIQIIEMKVVGLEYMPNRFTVKRGIPVEWRIDAREAEGCGRVLVARGIGITKLLSVDAPTVISFTPERAQEIAFNCGMGMMTPNSAITVVN